MAGRMDDDVSWRRLYRRWFVEYNPLALLSATFILGGIWLLSREAAQHASLAGHLGVAASQTENGRPPGAPRQPTSRHATHDGVRSFRAQRNQNLARPC